MGEAIAVIFDMDGVLIDSEPDWQALEVEVLGALGVPLTPALAETTTGLRVDEVVAHWRARHPFEGSTGAISDRISMGVASRVRASGEALPGALELLTAIRAAGVPLGLATSSSSHLIDAVVGRLELDGIFDAVVSGPEAVKGKPDPEIYTLCAQRLGVSPIQCVAVEDSVAGVRSARSAGMRCVAVESSRMTRAALAAAGANRCFQSLRDLDLETLLTC